VAVVSGHADDTSALAPTLGGEPLDLRGHGPLERRLAVTFES
jgi:hypothetical protein